MDTALILNGNMLHEDDILSSSIQRIRKEISDAILYAKVNNAYNKDVQLSIGTIHINPYGSVSEFSFNGLEVTDIDRFIVTNALKVSSENYRDIRSDIEQNPQLFSFYPIVYKGKTYYTVLKTSKFFEHLFGSILHNHELVTVKYALKYLIISVKDNEDTKNYVFLCGLFSPESQIRKIIIDAGRTAGSHADLFYCFAPKSNYLLRVGEIKSHFVGFEPREGKEIFDFYNGSVESVVFWVNRTRDSNSKIKMKESKRRAYKVLIEIQYGSISNFCKIHSINEKYLSAFLMGVDNSPIYLNGDKLTMTRISELLDVQINESEEGLKDKNLLKKVHYKDIPDGDIGLCWK